MEIKSTPEGAEINAMDVLIIGFGGDAVSIDLKSSITFRMGNIMHANSFGTGWLGRVRLAMEVYRVARIMRKVVKEEQEPAARQTKDRS